MKLTRYQPSHSWGLLEDFHHELSRLFDIPFSNFSLANQQVRLPSLDVWEDEANIYLEADLPGFEQKDIKISAKGNQLEISAKREEKHQEKNKKSCYFERFQGQFYRSIGLPSYADSSKAKADYNKGVLRLTLPKKEEAKEREIKIDVN